jgi:uncharacterized membrane protein
MNTELTLLITRSANIYFWLFVIFSCINILYQFTDEYKENIEILKKVSKVKTGLTLTNFIMWFLFLLSNYYR